MSVLTAAARRAIPASKFGEPGQRKYPMPRQESTPGSPKPFAAREHARGALSAEAKAHIDRMANHILGHGDSDGDEPA